MRPTPVLFSLALTLGGCFPFPKHDDTAVEESCGDTGLELAYLEPVGAAPWDGFRYQVEIVEPTRAAGGACEDVVIDDFDDRLPLVRDESAVDIPVEERQIRVTETIWKGQEELAAGTYHFVGLDGETLGWEASFEVLPYGRDPSFDPASVIGGTWLLDTAAFYEPWGVLVSSIGNDTYLQILAVDGEAASFRLVTASQWEDISGACTLLEGVGTLTATGDFTWSQDPLPLPTDPPIEARNATLHFGFLGDGSTGAGADLWFSADTEAVATWMSTTDHPDEICDLAAGFGIECDTCPGGQSARCLPVALYGGTLTRSTTTLPADPPPCVIALEEDSLDCDFGCSTTRGRRTGALALLAMILAVALRRR